MQGLGYVLFFPLFMAGMIAIVTYLYLTRSIERYLERMHHSTWLDLGSPHLVFNNSLLTSKNLHRFLGSLKRTNCDDKELLAHVKRWKRARVTVVAIFLSMAAALLFEVFPFS
jgi:hypothetical protein